MSIAPISVAPAIATPSAAGAAGRLAVAASFADLLADELQQRGAALPPTPPAPLPPVPVAYPAAIAVPLAVPYVREDKSVRKRGDPRRERRSGRDKR